MSTLDHRWRCPDGPDDLMLEFELHRLGLALDEHYPPPDDAWLQAVYAAAGDLDTRTPLTWRERARATRDVLCFCGVLGVLWMGVLLIGWWIITGLA